MVYSLKVCGEEPIRDSLEGVRSVRLRRFLDVWNQTRLAEDLLPSKDGLDPLVMARAGLLPHIWLVEVPENKPPRYRLAGENIVQIFGRGLRGVSVTELFDLKGAEIVTTRWRRACKEKLGAYSIGRVYPENALPYIGERLVLPLIDKKSNSHFIVGVTDYKMDTETSTDSHLLEFDTPVTFFVSIVNLWAGVMDQNNSEII
ncbi:MAG: PAS domain-containing protein [Thalassobaculaceae bacterium]